MQSVEIDQTVILSILKHFKTSSQTLRESRCDGKLYGSTIDGIHITMNSPSNYDMTKFKSVDTFNQDKYVIGVYLCGNSLEVNDSIVQQLQRIKEEVFESVLITINPDQSIKENKLIIKAFMLNKDEKPSVNSLTECKVEVVSSTLAANCLQSLDE